MMEILFFDFGITARPNGCHWGNCLYLNLESTQG